VDRERAWQLIEQERLSLADLLSGLTPAEWEHPSLCAGWRVRDVAAHVALAPMQSPGVWSMLVEAVRARGSFDRLNHDVSVRHADRPGADLVMELRAHAASRRLPAVTNYRNILFDILVHGQDIAIPLRRPRVMPLDAAVAGLDRVWTAGWPFWAKRRLAGFHLSATDAEWSAGTGWHEVRGPVSALLLLLTGRAAALDQLSGDGLAELSTRLSPVANQP
jgi:uncharacterized protein (TIGR03083 family)